MRLTPLDIRKQPFQKAMMGGFDRDQVNSFLEQVASEYEQLIRQNDEYAGTLRSLEEQLEHYRKIEKVLNDTLITAQKATDDARLNAQKEAELIIREAQLRAEKYEEKSRQNVATLESEIISLRTQRDSFLTRLRSMLKDQLALVEIMGGTLKDPNPKDPVTMVSQASAREHVAAGRVLSQLGRPLPPQPHAHPPMNLRDDDGDAEMLDEVPANPVV